MSQPIYLDYAAATPLDEQVQAAMQPYLQQAFYNPSATYLAARQVAQDLGAARARVASVFGARANEVVFTAGGTEANNLAINGVMQCFPKANIIVSAIEHESVLAPAARYDCRLAPVQTDGLIDLAALADLIDDDTVLVSIMYANNEVGTIQPVADIARLLETKRRARTNKLPLYFHSDAAQAPNYLDIHVSRLGVDLLTINGGKIYGPKQSGALYVSHQLALQPQTLGGGQERGLRSGTENVAQDIGLAAALQLTQANRLDEVSRLQQLQTYFMDQLLADIPTTLINGSRKKRLPNNVHVTFPGQDNERLLMQLDENGIMAAAGSACSASDEEPSHVLRAIGVSEVDAQASLRFTFGRSTTKADIDATLVVLRQIVS